MIEQVLVAASEMLGVTAASVAIIEHGEHRGALALSGAGAAVLDDLQFTLGEGPCIAADHGTGPVLEPDLTGATAQWPAFAPSAVAHGCRATFAFPLRKIGRAHV